VRSSTSSSSPRAKAALLLLAAGAVALGCTQGCSSDDANGATSSPEGGAPDGASRDASASSETGAPLPPDAATGDTSAPGSDDAGVDAPAPEDAGVDAPSPQDGSPTDAADAADSGPGDAGTTPASWMGALPGSTSIAALSIPGTHDTGATVELSPGTTKCQDLSVADQLTIGVRYFDIRCRNVSNEFAIYHTNVDQNLSFDQVLQSIYAFFSANPGETLVMSMKEEIAQSGSTNTFEQTFDSYVMQHPERWYLSSTIPTLDQARGKIVLLRRFGATILPAGIDATAWADNTTFTIAGASATLRIQDYYQVTDDASKWTAITGLFSEALQGDAGVLYLNNTSAYFQLDSGLEDIPSVANVINPELASYFTTNTSGRYGIVAMDFVDAAKSALVLRTNF
jgi:1-phosphatidylinositol phosphodiesterase